MINIATEYIENHRLRFNPHKTICHIMGQNPFTTIPRWYINGVSLDIEDILVQFWEKTEAKNTVKTVVEQHIVTFWAPGAGIKSSGVNPQTALHLFNVGVSSTLTYGCASIYINKSQLVNLDKYQVKLIKQCLGLKCRTRTTALMKALGIEYISSTLKQFFVGSVKSMFVK